MCGSSSSPEFALCSQLVGGDCWRCRYAAGYVTKINSSLLHTVLELSMAQASAKATQVALHRPRWQLYVHYASAAMAGIASLPLVACGDSAARSCKPCSCCQWRWRLRRLLVRPFVVAVVCFVSSTRRRRLLEMPVRSRLLGGIPGVASLPLGAW